MDVVASQKALKAYLVSHCPVKNQQKDCNSESSEFPASSPSNPQMQRKSRPPLLKNTLPADAFERGLALIATKTPQMTMNEKIELWDCTDDCSDVEDVVNFDAAFAKHEEERMKMLSKNKYELKTKATKGNNVLNPGANANACYSFTEFQRRLLAIDPRKSYFQCNEQKHNSKLTSEEDEKPSTSNNCVLRNRDTPLKKRACKYKRAAEPIAHLPNKKSSSSDTPKVGASSPKKRVQHPKTSTANAVGGSKIMNEKLVNPSSSDVSSQPANQSSNMRHAQTQQQTETKPKSIKIMDPAQINSKWNIAISSNNTARNEEESFFRWRRLSREIDKIGSPSVGVEKSSYQRRHISSSPPRVTQDLIQIRYDFIEPKNEATKASPESNTYNVVFKSLKKEEDLDCNKAIAASPSSVVQQGSEKLEDSNKKTEGITANEAFGDTDTLSKDFEPDLGTEFHQQHEFCNYLGLTEMSTANAISNAAAELLQCNLARRSLRVRHLEHLKARGSSKSPSETVRGKDMKEKHEINQGSPDDQSLAGTARKTSNTSERASSSSASCIDKTKETKAKIQILCQISSMNDDRQEEISNESVKSLYRPIRFTPQLKNDELKENCEQTRSAPSDTKYIELRPKTPSIKQEPNEVQELHEKVQNYLKEARKAVPNIFIVQSLESTSVREKPKPQSNDNVLEVQNNQSPKLSESLQSTKSRRVSKAGNHDDKKQRPPKILHKTSTRNRKLCTRSMLNLNQQRQLRNRKVILKLLKTYSNFKIKVQNSKDEAKKKERNDVKSAEDRKMSMDDSFPSKKSATLAETNSNQDLIAKKRQEIPLPLKIDESDKKGVNKIFEEHDHLYSNKSKEAAAIRAPSTAFNAAIKKFRTRIADTNIDDETCPPSKKIFDPLHESEKPLKSVDVAVQTDLEALIENLPVFVELTDCKIEESIQLLTKINANMISCSDVVTSTTSGVGETKNSQNLVIKKLSPQELQSTATTPDENSSNNKVIGLNSNPTNISMSDSNTCASGIHALSEQSKPLRNPLKESAGAVLHIYFESDILIVIQESLISFWKYIRVLNALLGKPAPPTKKDESHEKPNREAHTSVFKVPEAPVSFHKSKNSAMSSPRLDECDWIYLGEKNRLKRDTQIKAPFTNRLCFSESRPVYVEMFCRELLNEQRECHLLSCYVNVYFFNEEDQKALCHSVQLDTIQSLPSDVMYIAINESRYFILAWPQANVLGKVRSGLCKYALAPDLDMLATTRDFRIMRHNLKSLECLNDGKLLGFGDTELTVWDHRSGDVLMDFDLDIPIGRNLGTFYYPRLESGQNNVVVIVQHVQSESSSELLIIACYISHLNPSRRILLRHSLSDPKIGNISGGVNNGEHLVIQTATGEEIVISCNDPRQLILVPAQKATRFYTRGRSQVVELTDQTLTVDSFSNCLLKIAAGLNEQQKSVAEKKSDQKIWCA